MKKTVQQPLSNTLQAHQTSLSGPEMMDKTLAALKTTPANTNQALQISSQNAAILKSIEELLDNSLEKPLK